MPRYSSFSSNGSQQQGGSPPNNTPLLTNQGSVATSHMPGLQRQDTVPLHTLARHQMPNANHLRDHCDGPSAMEIDQHVKFTEDAVSSQEISSSQMLAGQSSPSGQRSEDHAGLGQMAGVSQVSPVDRSIGSWLGSLGCQQYLEIFNKKGIRTIDQLDEVNLEDFAGIAMPQNHREKLWKAIRHFRNPVFTSTPSSLLRTGSNASTASLGNLSGLSASQVHRIQATRFTLKQTMSFKVKEEKGDS